MCIILFYLLIYGWIILLQVDLFEGNLFGRVKYSSKMKKKCANNEKVS